MAPRTPVRPRRGPGRAGRTVARPGGTRRGVMNGWSGPRLAAAARRPSPARRGRPARLALRVLAALAVGVAAVLAAGPHPAARLWPPAWRPGWCSPPDATWPRPKTTGRPAMSPRRPALKLRRPAIGVTFTAYHPRAYEPAGWDGVSPAGAPRPAAWLNRWACWSPPIRTSMAAGGHPGLASARRGALAAGPRPPGPSFSEAGSSCGGPAATRA
jgi:hypothetical protein